MRAKFLIILAGVLAFGTSADTAHAATGRELMALSTGQQSQYLGNVIEAVTQSFQTADGGTVRSNCVNRWYRQDAPGAKSAVLANAAKFPDEDPVRIAMAMMIKKCGKDKEEGMRLLRDRVANKLDAADEAAQRARTDAEAELVDIQRRAWRLPDGRRIYESKNGGGWRFEDGAPVPPALVNTRIPPK